jgi:L-alanine-DL-glutamate epimerase-like enolase superfamily enzyme
MRITRIECDYLSPAITIPIRETPAHFPLILVVVETDTGARGVGFSREYGSLAAAVQHIVLDNMAPFLIGRDPVVPDQVWHEAAFSMPGSDYRLSTGIFARAVSAVDQALWDLRGQAAGEPVYRLLGGAQPEVEIYVTFGLNIYTPEEEAEAATRLVSAGYRSFKLQGANADRGRDIQHDARRVQRLREQLGDDARIMIDGGNNYDLRQAIELARLIEPYRVAFFDEPLFAKDPLALRRLHDACPGVPLAGRSRGGNIWDNRDLLVSGVLAAIGTNVRDQGGFTQAIKVAHAAELFQLPVVTGGGWHLQNGHLIAGVTNGWMTEYHALAGAVGEALFVDPIRPSEGKLRMPSTPGLGLTLNEAAIEEAKARGRAELAA